MYRMKIHYVIALVASLLIFNKPAGAQLKKNGVYTELGGASLLAGVNYERKLLRKYNLYATGGLGVYGKYLTVPMGMRYVFPVWKDRVCVDLSAQTTYNEHERMFLYALYKLSPDWRDTKCYNESAMLCARYYTKQHFFVSAGLGAVNTDIDVLPQLVLRLGKAF
jgi:hypothetical protein